MESPSVPPSGEMRFCTRARTRWSDEDKESVLNNAVFLTLMEEARFDWGRRLGLLEGERFPFVLHSALVRWILPGRGGAEVDVELRTVRLGRTSFQQAYRIREATTGEVWCEAEAVLVCWDPATGESRPLPDAFRRAIEAYEEPGTS